MNLFRVPGLELYEPLKRRPLKGAATGALVGVVIGLLTNDREVYGDHVIITWTLAGLITGATIGALLPEFRRRFTAGLAVGVATSLGWIVAGIHEPELPVGAKVLMGFVGGLVYAIGFWDYRG